MHMYANWNQIAMHMPWQDQHVVNNWNVQPTKMYQTLLPTILAWVMNLLSKCLEDSLPQLRKTKELMSSKMLEFVKH